MSGTDILSNAQARRSYRVLLVDDNPIFLEILKSHLLEKRGSFLDRPHGQQLPVAALNCLKSNPRWDLAILDINMPVVDGLQLLTIVKRNHPRRCRWHCSVHRSSRKPASIRFGSGRRARARQDGHGLALRITFIRYWKPVRRETGGGTSREWSGRSG